jgi:hypothetical protein
MNANGLPLPLETGPGTRLKRKPIELVFNLSFVLRVGHLLRGSMLRIYFLRKRCAAI